MPDPVLIEQVRECHFRAKGCRECGRSKAAHRPFDGVCDGYRRQHGCARCGRPKSDRAHFGAPPSYNAFGGGRGTGAAAMVGAGLKQSWERIFVDLLAESGLPKGLERVYVEGEVTFPDRREDRDQGNFRVVLEKALGDALDHGGWLARDTWDRYQFGQLSMRVVPGESATRLVVFPYFPERAVPEVRRSGEQMGLG
jgi:hypothetical protein